MSISVNYPQPINVNGFVCKNCTDVDYAKKHIDPAHPRSGPYGVNAASDPSVRFGGNLSHLNTAAVDKSANPATSTSQAAINAVVTPSTSAVPGQNLNISV